MKMYDSDKPDNDIKVIGNNVEQYTMGIEISSKVFSMNIDGIYQDKYGSTVRELSANALDIHKQCGIIDKPFDIHVPSILTGKFIIRDYGCGLSKENILKFFGQLFCSSKDKENDSVGFFGIGCKSPFTVTDDFLVVSVHEGIRTEYAFSRENKDTPRCIVLSSKPTDEPSGISITIDSGETEEWMVAIRNQLLMFPTKPNVYMDGELIDVGYYKLKKYGNAYYGTGLPKSVYISQGGLIYPIDQYQFPTIPFKKAIHSKSFVIYQCEIGQITVPPDRERIEITQENIDNLGAITRTANDSIDSDVLSYFFENYKDTYKSMNDVIASQQNLVDMRSIIRNKLDNPLFTNDVRLMTTTNNFYPSLYKRLQYWGKSKWLKSAPSYYSSMNGKYNRSKNSTHNLTNVFTGNIPIIVLPYNGTISTAYDMFKKDHRSCYIFHCRKDRFDEVVKVLEDYKEFFESKIPIIQVSAAAVKQNTVNNKLAIKANPVITKSSKFYKVDTTKNKDSYYMEYEEIGDGDAPNSNDDFYLMEVDNYLTLADNLASTQYMRDIQQIVYSGLLDKPIYFMKTKYFRNFKYGTKVNHDDLVNIMNNSDKYYEFVLNGRASGWSWSKNFTITHQNIIKDRMKKRSNIEIDSICKTLNIDLSSRKHPLKDVIVKLDTFSKVKIANLDLLKDVSISSKDVRGLIKNYFVGEAS